MNIVVVYLRRMIPSILKIGEHPNRNVSVQPATGLQTKQPGGIAMCQYDYELLCEEMRKCIENPDTEAAHHTADDILCTALKKLDCYELVNLFRRVSKWYS